MRVIQSELRRPDAIAIRGDGSRLGIAFGLGAIVTMAVEVGILAYRRSRALGPASSSVTPDRTDPKLAVGRRPGVPKPTLQPVRRVERVTMLLPNNAYPQDVRVRHEAESLVAAGHVVEVIAPRHIRQPFGESVNGVEVRRFPAIQSGRPILATLVAEHLVAVVALHVAALRALFRGSTVLHIHNPPDMLFLAGAMFRVARRHVVFDHHDLGPELVAVRLRFSRTSYGSPEPANGLRLPSRAASWPRTTPTQTLQPTVAGRRRATSPSYVTGRPRAGYVCRCLIVPDP